MISSGVLVARSICGQKIAVSAPITREITAPRYTQCTTYLRSSSSSLAPKAWATGMENPEQMPMQKPRIRKFSEPVEPTAASASDPR